MTAEVVHGFSGAEVAALLAGGAKPREVRKVLEVHRTLEEYLASDPLSAGLPDVEPVGVDLGDGWALALGGEGYPAQLAAAPSPPVVLFGRGDPSALAPGVAVVGTREITALGEAAAVSAVAGAAAAGVPVHSGMARGCDVAAHREALRRGVKTVAVLGSGADLLTPRESAAVGEEILAAGGAVVSELLPGTPVRPQQLMARNRIVAGLSTVLVVCEASLGSGTMGAVRNMLGAGRPVVVPLPKVAGRSLAGAEALLALGSDEGVDPALLGIKGGLAEVVRKMKPVAHVAKSREDLEEIVQRLSTQE